jgi:endonuclease-3 related protein
MRTTRESRLDDPPLRAVYRALLEAWGPQGWWPARTRLEMMIGAILTQNTAWTNVEKALANLRRARMLSVTALHRAPVEDIAALIHPSGTYTVKAHRIKHFIDRLVARHGGNIGRLFRGDTAAIRAALLSVHGIGPETADCMLLYAGRHPVFVIDAYTRRFMERHGWASPHEPYDLLAARFTRALAAVPAAGRVQTYNEYHALIVALAKRHCRARPDCATCPLRRWLPAHPHGKVPG